MIKATGLKQVFKSRSKGEDKEIQAVKGVSFQVQEGEIVGFLGPNGAGKTTTIRMLTTLLKPDAGTAKVAGYDIIQEPKKVRNNIGYVSQSGGVGQDLPAYYEVINHGLFYGLDKKSAEKRARSLFEQLDLANLWERPAKAMSGGQKRRLEIAMGLINNPELVILDEPSTGLDPQARSNLWKHIRDLRDVHGTTVFLTTHYLDEADALSDRILVIDNGEIVADGTPRELKAKTAGDLIVFEPVASESLSKIANILERIAKTDLEITSKEIKTRLKNSTSLLPEIIKELEHQKIVLKGLDVIRPTLDDVFFDITGKSLREDN